MRVLTFKHGIHPDDGKAATNSVPTEYILPPAGCEMVYPMVQHLGAPCEPIVAVGDKVLFGQKIADSSAFVSAPIHSTVSGVVKEFRKTVTPTGIVCNAIVIENDGEDTETEELRRATLAKTEHRKKDYLTYKKEDYLKTIREAGIVGLGGAGFPAHVKLNPPADKKIEFVIVNAAECEPYLTTDHRVLLEEAPRLVRGLEILLQIHPDAKGIIAIETNKPDAIKVVEQVAARNNRIEVVGLVPKYPQGSEKQLIYACTGGREVPSGGLPADVGCIVNNVDTVIAIDRAVVRERPLMRKIVTITGDAVKNPGNFKVRLGMSLKLLIELTGGLKEEPYKIISGGPMMGVAMFDLDVPIIKTSSGIIALTKKAAEVPAERNCIRCGKCVEHCPMSLMPFELNRIVLSMDNDLFVKNNGLDCIECGSCSFVCPAKRNLAQSIRFTRRAVMSSRKK